MYENEFIVFILLTNLFRIISKSCGWLWKKNIQPCVWQDIMNNVLAGSVKNSLFVKFANRYFIHGPSSLSMWHSFLANIQKPQFSIFFFVFFLLLNNNLVYICDHYLFWILLNFKLTRYVIYIYTCTSVLIFFFFF